MKKLFVSALIALSFTLSGCINKESKPQYPYYVGVEVEYTEATSRGEDDIDDNVLYNTVLSGVTEINVKYGDNTFSASDDSEALARYDKVLEGLKALMASFESEKASGRDFGASTFKLGYRCTAQNLVESHFIKRSELFEFKYEPNLRVILVTQINIDTKQSQSYSGQEMVLVSDAGMRPVLTGWTVYNEDGSQATKDMIKGIEVVIDGDNSFFKVNVQATKGVNAGKFYILATVYDENDPEFIVDLKVSVTHTTE